MYSKKKDIKPQPPQQQNIGYVQRTAGGIGQYRNIPQKYLNDGSNGAPPTYIPDRYCPPTKGITTTYPKSASVDPRNKFDMHEINKSHLLALGTETQPNYSGTLTDVLGTSASGSDIHDDSTVGPTSATLTAPPTTTTTGGDTNIAAGIEDTYVEFDSLEKDSSSNSHLGEYHWTIASLNNLNSIQNIVGMRITKLYVPRIQNDSTLSPTPPDYLFFKQIYMQVSEFPTSQLYQKRSVKYAWKFDVGAISSIAVELTPQEELIYFKQPFQTLSTLTCTFLIPPLFNQMPLPYDTVFIRPLFTGGAGSPGYNPARFQLLSGTCYDLDTQYSSITAPTADSVAVIITSLPIPSGSVQTRLLNPAGVFITNLLTTTTFEIGPAGPTVDMTTIVAPAVANAYDGSMIILKNRVSFGINFITATNTKTTGLVPTHQ